MAEGAGFEPAQGLLPRVFETRAIGRYANPPLRAREESNLQPPGPQPGVLSIELRALAE